MTSHAFVAVCVGILLLASAAEAASPTPPHGTTVVRNKASSDQLRWFTIGDWGACDFFDVITQMKVEGVMDTVAKTFSPDIIVNVGDNFYNDGVTSTTDSRWDSTWYNMYKHSAIELPWWNVLGNHDYIDNPQAEVEYSQKGLGDGRWNMPARYYTHTFEFGAGTTAQFVFIDTMMLATATTMRVADEELVEGEITQEMHEKLATRLRADAVPHNGTLQLQWIKKTLAASTADWLFVVGHYPVYSGGSHGNTPELQEQLKPLLETYNVDAYMDGHDHTMQVLYSNNVYYYVSGGGSKTSSHMKKLPQTLYGVDDKPGFDAMTIDADTMTVAVYHDDGHIDFQHSHARRAKTQRGEKA